MVSRELASMFTTIGSSLTLKGALLTNYGRQQERHSDEVHAPRPVSSTHHKDVMDIIDQQVHLASSTMLRKAETKPTFRVLYTA